MYGASIIQLAVTDSTNNYAMQLVDGNTALHGTTIIADMQTAGKGQRGRQWMALPGESVLMSVILTPVYSLLQQFQFNASVAMAIVNVLQDLFPRWQVRVKWPNDIIVNDKKAGGILIENILRGALWANSVVGIGVNLLQDEFPDTLPFATSLKIESGLAFDRTEIAIRFRDAILAVTASPAGDEKIWNAFNLALYKRGEEQQFITPDGSVFTATVAGATSDGALLIQRTDGKIEKIFHGQYTWQYGYVN